MVVVGAVDGMAYVLDPATGLLLSSFDTGGPTVNAYRASPEAPLLVASANAQNPHLFMVAPPRKGGGGPAQVQQLNSTLRDLVRRTPFRDLGGHLYVGSENSKMMAYEFGSSRLHRFSDQPTQPTFRTSAEGNEMSLGTLFLGRKEYTVRAFDKLQGAERFNISMGEFSSAFRNLGGTDTMPGSAPPDVSQCTLRFVSTTDGTPTLYAYSQHSGKEVWKTVLPSTAVVVFTFAEGATHPCEKSLNERTTFCSFALHGCVGNMDGLSREGAPRPASRSVIISDFRGHAFALAPEPRSVQEGVAVSATQESPGLLRLNNEERKLLPAPGKPSTAKTVAGSEVTGSDFGKLALETSGNWHQDLLTWTGKRRAMLTKESRRQEEQKGEATGRDSALEAQDENREHETQKRVYEVVSSPGKHFEAGSDKTCSVLGMYELSGTVDAASALAVASWGALERPLATDAVYRPHEQAEWSRLDHGGVDGGRPGYPQLTYVDIHDEWGWILTGQIVLAIIAGVVILLVAMVAVWQLRQPPPQPQVPVVVTKTLEVRSAIVRHQQDNASHNREEQHVDGGQVGNVSNSLSITNHVLGYGSHGTIVYQGEFNRRPVAVKRMLADFYDMAEKEISFLIASDEHPNILRYYAKEVDGQFVYLVLELCPHTLVEFIEGPEAQMHTPETLDPGMGSLLLQLTQGVCHLHDLSIVHRDLKPANILISDGCKLKISDMGLGRKLELEQHSFSYHTEACGSEGWQAPEVIARSETRLTKAVDIFSLGCVLYYMMSGGAHPFGKRSVRQLNISRNKSDLRHLRHLPLAADLVMNCIDPHAWRRPEIREVLNHPLFWDPIRTIDFLQNASDRVDVEEPGSELDLAMEEVAKAAVGKDWGSKLDRVLMSDLRKHRTYRTKSLRDLLRVVRNKAHHWRSLPEDMQLAMGPYPDGFLRYFMTRFPNLVVQTYNVLKTHCRSERMLRQYFDPVQPPQMPSRAWWPQQCLIM